MGFGLRSTTATFVYMPHSAVVIRFEKALPLRTREKGGRRERPPPPPHPKKTGGSCGPLQMAFAHASVPAPMGSLTSSFIPAGRLGKTPFPLALHRVGSVLAVKGSLRRFAPWTAPRRSERRAAYEGKGGVQAIREASPQALLHGLFSHAPSLDKQQVSKYSQHQAIGGRLRFWNRSFKASCSSPWTVFLSWAASTRSCW